MRPVIVSDFGDLGGLHFLIARRGHLQSGRKIGPELKTVHAPRLIALGHFLMNDAASRGHPLHVAGGNGTVIAHAVAVFDRSRENIRDRLDPPMRMPGKSRQIVFRDVVAEVVEQQERIELIRMAEAERTAEVHSCAFERGLGFDQALHRTDRHGRSFHTAEVLLYTRRY